MINDELLIRPQLWKMLERQPCSSGAEYIAALQQRGYRPSDWIIDIASRPDFPVNTVQWPLPLVRVKVASFGFTEPLHLSELYAAITKAGFENPPAEAALALRFAYDEQPTGEWLRVATPMDAMIDSDKVPHLPKLGKALGNFYLETYWAYPQAVFHPHNEFVLVDRRLQPE